MDWRSVKGVNRIYPHKNAPWNKFSDYLKWNGLADTGDAEIYPRWKPVGIITMCRYDSDEIQKLIMESYYLSMHIAILCYQLYDKSGYIHIYAHIPITFN